MMMTAAARPPKPTQRWGVTASPGELADVADDQEDDTDTGGDTADGHRDHLAEVGLEAAIEALAAADHVAHVLGRTDEGEQGDDQAADEKDPTESDHAFPLDGSVVATPATRGR